MIPGCTRRDWLDKDLQWSRFDHPSPKRCLYTFSCSLPVPLSAIGMTESDVQKEVQDPVEDAMRFEAKLS